MRMRVDAVLETFLAEQRALLDDLGSEAAEPLTSSGE